MQKGIESLAPFITVNGQSQSNRDCSFPSLVAFFASGLFWPIRFDVKIVSIGNDCNVKPDWPESPLGTVIKSNLISHYHPVNKGILLNNKMLAVKDIRYRKTVNAWKQVKQVPKQDCGTLKSNFVLPWKRHTCGTMRRMDSKTASYWCMALMG